VLELVVLVAAGGLLLWITRGLTFLMDEWAFIQYRLDWTVETFLRPHNQHLLVLEVLLYKVLFVTAGIAHYLPYRLLAVILHLLCVALVFEFAQRRIGLAAAAAISAPILVLGTGWFVVLNPFNIQWTISLSAGIGILLLLAERSRRHDVAIALLLLVALAASSLGAPLALGLLAAVVAGPDRWRRMWVVVVPLAVYGAWYLDYGVDASTGPGYEVSLSPVYFFHLAAGGVGGLLGLPLGSAVIASRPWITHAVHLLTLGVLVVLTVAHVRRRREPEPELVMVVVTLALYWLLLTVSRGYQHLPYSTQYVYVSVVLIVLVGVAALPAGLPTGRAVAVLAGVMAISTGLNLLTLVHWSNLRRTASDGVVVETTALEIAGDEARPAAVPDRDEGRAPVLRPRPYLAAVRRLGSSPALSPSGLLQMSEPARIQADAVLKNVLGVRPVPYTPDLARFLTKPGTLTEFRACRRARPGGDQDAALSRTLPPQGVVVKPNGGPVTLRLRRFASTFAGAPLGTAVGDTYVRAARGEAAIPWRLQASSRTAFAVC
jgi:hypothetical protein